MKSMHRVVTIVLLITVWTAVSALAQEMPVGPPEEMKQLAWLEGDWDVVMEFKEGDTVEVWTKSEGTCHYQYILGGGAMQMEYKSEYMQMPFEGLGIECFDRETGHWQTVWLDNMGCRVSVMTGRRGDGKSVYTGQDIWQGQKYMSRMSTFDETETSFNWTMEMSTDGGKTWVPNGRATYTKKTK